jgi:hypothetical protein
MVVMMVLPMMEWTALVDHIDLKQLKLFCALW